jgi:hypothetical protein
LTKAKEGIALGTEKVKQRTRRKDRIAKGNTGLDRQVEQEVCQCPYPAEYAIDAGQEDKDRLSKSLTIGIGRQAAGFTEMINPFLEGSVHGMFVEIGLEIRQCFFDFSPEIFSRSLCKTKKGI